MIRLQARTAWFRRRSAMRRPEVDICVLCHNRDDVTARFLKHLAGHLEGVKAKVWVLDNGSTDGTWKLLKWFKENTRWWWPWARHKGLDLQILQGYQNIGFARGNNYLARKGRAPYICFINNDAFPRGKDWLSLMRCYAGADDYGAVGPISDNVMGIQHKVWDDKWPYVFHRAQVLSGFCLLMRREVFEEMDGWDERFLNGDEDLDLSLRLRKAGYLLGVCRRIFVHHECSQTLAPWCATRGESVKAHFEQTRMQLVEKHGPRCQNDIGFWEHLDRPESEWAAMGVMPNGEYVSPPGRIEDQVRATAREAALSADRYGGILQARKLHPAPPPAEQAGADGSGEAGELHPDRWVPGGAKWRYHVGTEDDETPAYRASPEGSECTLAHCATCEAEALAAG